MTPDGAPVTTPCWYSWVEGRFTISMASGGPRVRNLRNDPRVSLTVLADDWYVHVSLLGRAVEFRDDPDLVDIDALSRHYVGEPYEGQVVPRDDRRRRGRALAYLGEPGGAD